MTAQALVYPRYHRRSAPLTRLVLKLRYPNLDWLPRRGILLSLILLLTGLGLPTLPLLGLLTASWPLVFLGLGLAAVGGTLGLIQCGEI